MNFSKLFSFSILLVILFPTSYPIIFDGPCPEIPASADIFERISDLKKLYKISYYTAVQSTINHIFFSPSKRLGDIALVIELNRDKKEMMLSKKEYVRYSECKYRDTLTFNETSGYYFHNLWEMDQNNAFRVLQPCTLFWDRYQMVPQDNGFILWGCVNLPDQHHSRGQRHEEALWGVAGSSQLRSIAPDLTTFPSTPVGSITKDMITWARIISVYKSEEFRCEEVRCKPRVIEVQTDNVLATSVGIGFAFGAFLVALRIICKRG